MKGPEGIRKRHIGLRRVLMRGNRIAILYMGLATIVLMDSEWAPRVEGKEAGQITCTGKVIDEQGRPIAGAKVSLYERTYRTIEQSFKTRFEGKTLTKADGKFTFSTVANSDSYFNRYLVVEKEGFALGWANWNTREDTEKEIEIKLGLKAELAGIVVDDNDRPIPQARVRVHCLAIGEEDNQQRLLNDIVPELLTTQTDERGRFTFTNLPANAKAEFLVRKPGYTTVCTYTSSRDMKYATGQSDIKLVLTTEATIQGIVVEQDSAKPVPGIKLAVRREGNRSIIGQDPVSTAEDGTFSINALAAGKYVVQLVRRGDGLAAWVAEPVRVELETGQVQKDIRIEVGKGGMLEVRITDAQSEQPLEKAHVSIRDEMRNQWIYGSSDNEGIARIPLLPGAYQFDRISLHRYNSERPREAFTVENGMTKHLRYQLTGQPKITGVVRDENNRPVAGVKLKVCPMGFEEVSSDAEGKYEISWDPGMWGRRPRETTFWLLARHEGRNLAAVDEGISKDTKALDMRLKPGVTVTGRIVDPNGRGIPNANLTVFLNGPGWGSSLKPGRLRAGENGAFEIGAIPSGHSYSINADAEGYGSTRAMFVADDAKNNHLALEPLTLAVANLSVSGRVVDTQGNPVADARISSSGFGDGQPARLSTQADATGNFTLGGVCEGEINIRVDADHDGQRLSARVLTNGGATGITIVAREGRPVVQTLGTKTYDQIVRDAEKVIAGVALDESGSPVAGVPVGVCCHKKERETGKFTWMFSDFSDLAATTDKQGRFAIELQEDGEYNLRFSPDHHAALIVYDIPVGRKDLKVTLPEGGTVTGRLVRMDKGRKVPIPNVEVRIEQPDRASYTYLGFDRDRTTVTDAEGRFRFEHLRTKIRPRGSMSKEQWDPIARVWEVSYGDTSRTLAFYEGTKIENLELLVRPTGAQPLVGRALPEFDGIEIDLAADQTENRMMLVCFFDMNQRPSRHCMMELAKQAEQLGQKGVTVAAVQASEVDQKKLTAWAGQGSIPFPVGRVRSDGGEARSIWGVTSLPWLILADKAHVVIAGGFALGELNDRITQITAEQ